MAEVNSVEMGEVDEVHSKDDGAIVNGEVNTDVEGENEEDHVTKKADVVEPMEVDQTESDHVENNEETEKADVSAEVEETNAEVEEDGDVENSADVDSCADVDSSAEVDNDPENKTDVESNGVGNSVEETEESKDGDEEEADEVQIEAVSAEKEVSESVTSDKIVIEEISVGMSVDSNNEIHEIDDNDDASQTSSIVSKTISDGNTNSNDETIELNDSGGDDDGDVMIVESSLKENGTSKTPVTEVIDLDSPLKKQPAKATRKSSRNLARKKSLERKHSSEESDIEEVTPQDPLAVSDSISIERILEKPKKSSTIVVKDTKKLVEIASKTNHTPGKKEPTLVIIDTNSILSGRGPVPMNNKSAISTSPYTNVLPMALPAQGMYPANMRATITPIPINSNAKSSAASAIQAPLLPTLTDDMFVVEAPSFIVPYVYEKPPVKDFKEFVNDVKKQVIEHQKKLDEAEGDDEDEDEEDEKEEQKEKTKKRESRSKRNKDDDKDYKIEEEKDVDSEEEGKATIKPQDKPYSYFDSPLGKFFVDIGFNLVQEFVQSDLLKQQKRKREREGGQNKETDKTIHSLIKNLEYSKENNEPFRMTLLKCEFCNFKTESNLALAYHLETPHMKNFMYRCNFCTYEVRSPHDILFHMEAEHAIRGHLERAPAFHQCSNCPFEDNQKGKLSRHLVACMKKFKPDRNLEPPVDWEPPAKIPRVPKMRQQGLNATAAAYQAMSKNSQYQFLSKMQLQSTQQALNRGRGRPPTLTPVKGQQVIRPSGMMFKQTMSGGSVLVPTNYQLSGNQVFQVVGGQELGGRLGNHMTFVPTIPSASSAITIQAQNKKPVHQPSISITPLPRATTATPNVSAKPGDNNSKNSFVICEICDGYIKDLEQLRNHMQWIHKIKIHPKMIYNRPPLNCQKCQFRFFTDQGLERHLLGSHGLVTSSMQDAANKSKDSGRCPVCGRVYQWKLLNHVARDHNMTLKPAHLSYKCTVCTATFGMYKQFENHVYSAHSVVAKRVMDKKSASPAASAKDPMKPLKINDEITIIPQPPKSSNGASKEGSPSSSTGSTNSRNSTPSTSKNDDSTPSTSRAEKTARKNADGED